MCLILHQPVGKTFDTKLFVPARENNPHGFGVMFPMGDGRVKAVKGMFDLTTIQKIWAKLVEGTNVEVAAHFRFTTLGAKTKENCHPFQVLDYDKHGQDLYMMHNGTMSSVPRPKEEMSDTWHFVENYLRPVLVQKPELIRNAEFQKFLADIAGSSKLLFMGGQGLVTIINESMGSQRDGCWISNTYSIREKHKPHGNNASNMRTSGPNNAYSSASATYEDPDGDDLRHMNKRERRRIQREREKALHGGRTREERQADLDMAFAQMEDDGGSQYRGSHALTDAEFQAQELGEIGGFSDVEGIPI